ncbi:MAG: shikimate kinase [Spirochaetales bacterium]
MESNITLLMPLNNYKKKIIKLLANKLDMFYVDVEELLEFDIIDKDKAVLTAGQDYVNKLENKLVKTVSEYNNTIITLPYSLLNKTTHFNRLKDNSIIIGVSFSQEDYFKLLKKEKTLTENQIKLEKVVFNERNELMKNMSELFIECDTTIQRDVIRQILLAIDRYYN